MGNEQEQFVGKYYFKGCPAQQIHNDSFHYLFLYRLTHHQSKRTISMDEIIHLPNQCVEAFSVIETELQDIGKSNGE